MAVVNTADGEFKFKSFATQQVVFIIFPMGVDFQPSAEIEKGKNRNTVKSTPQKAKNNRLFLIFRRQIGCWCILCAAFLFISFSFIPFCFISTPKRKREVSSI